MYKTKLFTAALALASIVSFGQETEKETKGKLKLSGSVDAYYQTNLTQSDAGANIAPGVSIPAQNFGTSFVNQTGFALGLGNVVLSYEGAKTGAVLDLAFGQRGVDAVGGDVEFVNQLYAYWNVSDKVTLTAGRFNTYLGYEVISPVGNFNYSTSYLFSNGPFSHVGVKADFALSDDFSLMLAVMNVTDTNVNTNGAYALGAQLGYKGQFLNLYYDNEASLGFEVDYTGGFDVSEKFYLGINAAYADNDGSGFYGAALYPQYAISDAFSLGLRAEYFAELENKIFTDNLAEDDESVFGVTLTGSYTVENLTIKPELRLDSRSEDSFLDNDGDATKSLAAFTIGAIYSF